MMVMLMPRMNARTTSFHRSGDVFDVCICTFYSVCAARALSLSLSLSFFLSFSLLCNFCPDPFLVPSDSRMKCIKKKTHPCSTKLPRRRRGDTRVCSPLFTSLCASFAPSLFLSVRVRVRVCVCVLCYVIFQTLPLHPHPHPHFRTHTRTQLNNSRGTNTVQQCGR